MQSREIQMKSGNKDELKGMGHEMKGAIKAKAGKATGDSQLEVDGNAENSAGKEQMTIGQIERVINK